MEVGVGIDDEEEEDVILWVRSARGTLYRYFE